MKTRIILCGHSASGKDFLSNTFVKRNFQRSISYTTRPIRENEIEGEDYHFISVEEFQDKESQNFWYEFVQFNGWYYGTSNAQIHEDDIFIMTPSGISKLKPEDRLNSMIIFLDIPEDIRRKRIEARSQPGDSIERRLKADAEDFKDFKDFDLKINSADLADLMFNTETN